MNRIGDDRSYSGLVQKYIGTAYDKVALVAQAIEDGIMTPQNMQVIDSNQDFLDSAGLMLDLTKPYFTKGYKDAYDGGAAYYIYMADARRCGADGLKIIDPTVSWENQGTGAGSGCWVRQTSGNSDRGPEGPQGSDGRPGVAGADGRPGIQGIQGDDGPPGPRGLPGSPGPTGPAGPPGVNGADGQDGRDGHDGKPGINGVDGADGLKGDKGDPAPGITIVGTGTVAEIQALPEPANKGDMWLCDDSSDTAAFGHGFMWDTQHVKSGLNWVDVGQIQGSPGPVGSPGTPGRHGQDGRDGADGRDGVDGNDGQTGATGATGPQGPIGNGIRLMGAVSAVSNLPVTAVVGDTYLDMSTGSLWTYDNEIDVATRRTSSTKGAPPNWYNIGVIQGPKGNDGATGATGPAGPTGQPGRTGDRGAPGKDGATGPAGPTVVSGQAGNLAKIVSGKIFVGTQILKGTSNPAGSAGSVGDIYIKY